MHTFRRLNVNWRQEAGATPIEAQKAAGHASLDMTFLYTQTDEAREQEPNSLSIENRRSVEPEETGGNCGGRRCAMNLWKNACPETYQVESATQVPRALFSASGQVLWNDGGPERTRISDLYRVKVAL